jgi:hypothetical protein
LRGGGTFLLVLALSGCAASPPSLHKIAQPYRNQVKGLLAGTIDPWVVNPGVWGQLEPTADGSRPWPPKNKDANAAWYVLAGEIGRREDAEKSRDIELWQGGLRFCTSYRTMTLSVHVSPSSWASAPTATPQFTPARERVRQNISARKAAEQAIAISGPVTARIEVRLARRALYDWQSDGPDETGEDNYRAYLLTAEQCRIETANLVWLDQQLRAKKVVTGGDTSPRAINAAFRLLHQSASKSSILIHWLPVFEPFAQSGILDPNAYARSLDNVRISTKQPQKYGSYTTCRGEVDRSNIHFEGEPVDRIAVIANRAALKLPPVEGLEDATRQHCARTFPFSM